MSLELLNKKYDGNSLYDLGRDVEEALDPSVNGRLSDIPYDTGNIMQGTITVTVTWDE